MFVWEIVDATKGKLISGDRDYDVIGFSQDSRKVNKGGMYIPLKGEKFDGHDFIDSAFDNGAQAIITSKDVSYPDKIVIKVADTLKSLQDMARYLREHRNFKVVGVTGSVGKTSTRDMIYSVVSKQYKTLKTEGNYNNNIGLPLTMLRYQDEEVMILEMGMNHLNEITLLSKIASPDIAVITNVGTAHIGELGSRENILKAKLEIVDGMKSNAPLIINGDNDMLENLSLDNINVYKVGCHEGNNLHASNIHTNIDQSSFDIKELQTSIMVPVPGEHFITNALIAIGVGQFLDINIDLIKEGISEFELTKNRMDKVSLKDNIVLIDGTYNASEDSMKSSLDVLSKYPGRKIAVLADMLELGEYSQQLHTNVGEYAASKGIDILLGVGDEAKYIIDGAVSKGLNEVHHFNSNQDVIKFLCSHLKKNDTVLLKGSNGMKLKEVVQAIKDYLS